MSVSRETDKLAQYAALIRKWNGAINLVAPSTLDQVESRHIGDCLKLVQVSRAASDIWVDLGSGGGLPGLVVAICRPDLDVRLVESDKRKGSFLRSVIREVGLANATVIAERIETTAPMKAQQVSARALAPLPLLLSYVHRHLAPGGTAWLMKGRNWQEEVRLAQSDWSFNFAVHSSATDPDAAILEITELDHA